MLGIHIMAIVAIAASLGIVGGLIWVLSRGQNRWLLAVLLILELPVSALAYYYLRQPLDMGVKALGFDLDFYRFLTTWYAPITEEPAKLLPLALPFLFRRIDAKNGVAAGLALGLGFGLGEIAFLAYLIGQSPAAAKLPWYMFTGFLIERLFVAFLHGAMTATAIALWFKGVRWGILVSILLHYALNFPIYLASLGTFGLGRMIWVQIGMVWVVLMAIALSGLLTYFVKGRGGVRDMIGAPRTCPDCAEVYKPTIAGLNFLVRRYERCPHCRKWHWM